MTNYRAWLKKYDATLRLSLSYLAIIMVMSVAFSITIFHTSAHEIGRQIPPDSFFSDQVTGAGTAHVFFQNRIDEGRHELITRLIWLNVAVFLLGSLLSYLLARRTLEPIEEAMETQARFASDASHELRTPLAAMQTENEVALRDSKLGLPKAKALLVSNLEEVVRLRALADTLLQLAHADHHSSPPSPVKLNDAVSEAINNCLKAAQAKEIAIEDTIPKITVLGDLPSIAQVISIFLDNAIKYSEPKNAIQISAKTVGKEAWLSVTDKGAGISAQDLPHIFDRFYRADSSRSKQHVEGHGLGLSLASKLADQLNGELSAKSKPGKGSVFTLKIPLV
ncbi:MAG: putative Histidine kinase [Candidatus Saccharibacteria bacterium]|nr:putative Histidine kinase [Candidatus Saccharibacteria bacterium]